MNLDYLNLMNLTPNPMFKKAHDALCPSTKGDKHYCKPSVKIMDTPNPFGVNALEWDNGKGRKCRLVVTPNQNQGKLGAYSWFAFDEKGQWQQEEFGDAINEPNLVTKSGFYSSSTDLMIAIMGCDDQIEKPASFSNESEITKALFNAFKSYCFTSKSFPDNKPYCLFGIPIAEPIKPMWPPYYKKGLEAYPEGKGIGIRAMNCNISIHPKTKGLKGLDEVAVYVIDDFSNDNHLITGVKVPDLYHALNEALGFCGQQDNFLSSEELIAELTSVKISPNDSSSVAKSKIIKHLSKGQILFPMPTNAMVVVENYLKQLLKVDKQAIPADPMGWKDVWNKLKE